MSCAETAELIDLPFGLWTRVSRRKHEFSRIRQMAPMCTISIVFARWRQRIRRLSVVSCTKNCWSDQFTVWVVDSGGLKESQIQSYSPGHIWHHLANTTEPSVCGSDAVLCQITLTTCYNKRLVPCTACSKSVIACSSACKLQYL